MLINFRPKFCRGSSVAERWTENPKVVGSSPILDIFISYYFIINIYVHILCCLVVKVIVYINLNNTTGLIPVLGL